MKILTAISTVMSTVAILLVLPLACSLPGWYLAATFCVGVIVIFALRRFIH